MLAILACLAGIFVLLVISEILGRKKQLRGEAQRKFVHITAGVYIAFWPWIISWQTISWIGVAMLLVVLFNHRQRFLDFYSEIKRDTYGDVFFALAVILAPLITHQKVFFAIALLIMALGDSFANILGRKYGRRSYKVFGRTKTLIGSATMWVVSFSVLAAGTLLFAHNSVDLPAYTALILILPLVLVVVENVVLAGIDNLAIPVVALLAFHLVT